MESVGPDAAIAVAAALGEWAFCVHVRGDDPARWDVTGVSPALETVIGRAVPTGTWLGELLADTPATAALYAALAAPTAGPRSLRAELSLVRVDGTALVLGADVASLGGGTGDGATVFVRMGASPAFRGRMSRLQMVEQRLAVLADRLPVGVAFSDGGLRVVWTNDRARELFGRPAETLAGTGWLGSFERPDAKAVSAAVGRVVAGDDLEAVLQATVRLPDGHRREVRIRATPLPGTSGVGFLATFEDVTERSSLERRLHHEATHDVLTGLANRARLEEHLSGLLDRPGRCGVGVLFCDLDDFKRINDSLGHAAGDQLLIEVAGRLQSAVRDGDVVARFGGDEFVVCCQHLRSLAALERVAQRILDVLGQPVELAGFHVTVTPSIGLVLANASATVEGLVRDADAAMYEAKRAGKASYAVCSDELRWQARSRLHLESALRDGIDGGEIEVFYQPVVSLCSGKVDGFEALARWRRNGMLVPPNDFIPLAEDTGLVVDLGRVVLEQATADLARWRAEGIDGGVWVSVNVSARQLDGDLVPVVRRALETSGLPGDRLCLEVTESALLRDVEQATEVLARMRDELCVKVAIDDFGTGYSSLVYLQHFGFDVLKLDGAFVDELETSARSQGICRSVVALADGLGLRLVAEKVETVAQEDVLRSLGVSHVQGWLRGRPLAAAATAALLRAGDGWTA